MTLEELRLEDLLLLQSIFNDREKTNPYIGKYVIIRSNGSGVHSGFLESYDPKNREVILKKSRRLWKWIGFTLSEVANDGMKTADGKVCQELPEILITNVLEIIPCSHKAFENLSNYPVYIS